ncbi:hypothetical protein CBM2623_A70147 [Cupriavidus taiwanensis]|nr:hypothetical protein CBM2623_A70147 [Cupriavidus taiwanensis]
MAARGFSAGGRRQRRSAAVVAAARLPARTYLALARLVADVIGGIAFLAAAAVVVAGAGERGAAAAEAVVGAGARLHAVDLGLYVFTAFGAHAGHLPAIAGLDPVGAALGTDLLPERDLGMAGGYRADQARGHQDASHQVAQERAGEHADSQGPVALCCCWKMGSWYAWGIGAPMPIPLPV